MNSQWLRLTAALGGLALSAAALNLFGNDLNSLFLRYPGIDKVLHVVCYGGVYVLLHSLAVHVTRGERGRARLAGSMALLLAVLDESVQLLAPSRSVEAFDLIADVAGIALGWVSVKRGRYGVRLAVTVASICAAGYVTWDTRVKLADFSKGLRSSQQGDFIRAREHLQRAYATGMRTAGLYNELAWVEIESGVGEPIKAVEYAKVALEMQPDNADVLDTYGWALHHTGRTTDARNVLERAYAAKPDMFCIHYHLGAVYLAMGDREKAAVHFRRQVERRSTREAARAQEALVRMGAGE